MWTTSTRVIVSLVLMCIAVPAAFASEPCDAQFQQQLHDSQRFVDAMHVAKPGGARVFAVDGSEFGSGQVLWMQGRIRHAVRLCTRGGPQYSAQAAADLTEVRSLIASKHRGP